MTDATRQKQQTQHWSWSTGERAVNRVRAYEDEARGVIFLEFYERPSGGSAPTRSRISLGHADRTRAKAQAEQLAARIRLNEPVRSDELTLHALFDMYGREVTPDKSPSTQRHDRLAMRLFLEAFGPQYQVQSLSVREWNRFIRERRSGKLRPPNEQPRTKPEHRRREPAAPRPVGEAQVAHDLKLLLAVLNWATLASDGKGGTLLERNPLKGLPIPRNESPVRTLLTHDQYEAMRTAARAHRNPLVEIALLVAHETGHRIGAIRQLRWSDVDLEAGRITWRKELDKIRYEHRTVISEPLRSALKAERQRRRVIGDAWVFPMQEDTTQCISRERAHLWWVACAKKAQLPTGKRLGWHSLRRKFATELKHIPLKDLAALGGWKEPTTILQCYQQPDEATQKEALAARQILRSGTAG